MNTSPLGATSTVEALPFCWFCEGDARSTCECGRAHCARHEFDGHCFICALGLGLFELADEPEPVSDMLIYSLVAESNDPYVVVPPGMVGATPLPITGVERVLAAIMRMVKGGEGPV